MTARLVMLVGLLGAMLVPATAAERLQALGLSISMELPETFAPSTDAMGFLAQRGTAAVTLVDIPTTPEMWAGLQEPGAFEATFGSDPNLTLEPVELLQLGGRDFLLAQGISGSITGATARIWLAATGPTPGLLISFSQAEGVPPVLDRARVLAALASIEIGGPLSFEERLPATGVTLEPQAPFIHNAITMNSMITLSSLPEPVGVDKAVKVIILLLRGQSTPVPLKDVLGGYLGTAPDQLEATAARFGARPGIRVQGVINDRTGLVAYAAQIDDRVVLFIAQGPVAEFSDALVTTIDQIAQSVSPTAQ